MPKKETRTFREGSNVKISQSGLKVAVDKALEFLNSGLLPPHWDRDILLGHDVSEAASDKSSLSNVCYFLLYEYYIYLLVADKVTYYNSHVENSLVINHACLATLILFFCLGQPRLDRYQAE